MWVSALSLSISIHCLPPWVSPLLLHSPPCFFLLTHLPVPPCLLLALAYFSFGGAGCHHRLFHGTELADRPLLAPPLHELAEGAQEVSPGAGRLPQADLREERDRAHDEK